MKHQQRRRPDHRRIAVYADRLAKRGYCYYIILVARSNARLKALGARLTSEAGRYITPLLADLNRKAGLAKVEATMRDNQAITMTGRLTCVQ